MYDLPISPLPSLFRFQTTTTTRRIQTVQPPVTPVVRRVITTNVIPEVTSSAQETTASIFGTGGANNIRFENPDINYAFDLQ